jgi:transposase
MAKPYSVDLRKLVIEKIEKNVKESRVAKLFNVSMRTIRRWKNLKKENNSLHHKIAERKGKQPKIQDLEAFKKHVEEYPDLTQKERGVIFNVSSITILRALRQINFTKKKELWVFGKKRSR